VLAVNLTAELVNLDRTWTKDVAERVQHLGVARRRGEQVGGLRVTPLGGLERVALLLLGSLGSSALEDVRVVRRLRNKRLVAVQFLVGEGLLAFEPPCSELEQFSAFVLGESGGDERLVREFGMLEAGDEFESPQRDRLPGVPVPFRSRAGSVRPSRPWPLAHDGQAPAGQPCVLGPQPPSHRDASPTRSAAVCRGRARYSGWRRRSSA